MFKWKNFEHLRIPLQEIKDATYDFDEKYLIGKGAYGKVYKASLSTFIRDGEVALGHPTRRLTVAIKRCNPEVKQGKSAFKTEIKLLSSFKHRNVVSLIGFCNENNEMILVYEHAFNGSLDAYLGISGGISSISWGRRLKLCIGVARGLEYLHRGQQNPFKTIHLDIKSANILVDRNWEAKIADFGLSEFAQNDKPLSFKYHRTGTKGYRDPFFKSGDKLNEKADVYSFGVVLFEVVCGELGYVLRHEQFDLVKSGKRYFQRGEHLKKKFIDRYLNMVCWRTSSFLDVEANDHSLNVFLSIACKCVQENPQERPTMTYIIKELEESLKIQMKAVERLRWSLEKIKNATKNFDNSNIIGWGGSSRVYKGELEDGTMVAVKRFNHWVGVEEVDFLTEISKLQDYEHENIIALLGFSYEGHEKILVYEYASNGSLDKYLRNSNKLSLTWTQRLKICLGAAQGLDFIHTCGDPLHRVIHRDVRSANILLTCDWEAKISNFGLSKTAHQNRSSLLVSSAAGTLGYCDPEYMKTGVLTKASDVYSFGMVLFEILGKKLVLDNDRYCGEQLDDERKRQNKKADHSITEQIEAISLSTFSAIAYQCVLEKPEKRPTMGQVVQQLTEALKVQLNRSEQ